MHEELGLLVAATIAQIGLHVGAEVFLTKCSPGQLVCLPLPRPGRDARRCPLVHPLSFPPCSTISFLWICSGEQALDVFVRPSAGAGEMHMQGCGNGSLIL
jgi:hypothetical protein